LGFFFCFLGAKTCTFQKKVLLLRRKGFMKEKSTYRSDFEEYIRQGEPDKKERAKCT